MKTNVKNLLIFSASVTAVAAVPIVGIAVQAAHKTSEESSATREYQFAFIKATDNSTYDEKLFKFAETSTEKLKIKMDKSSSQADQNSEQKNIEIIINSGKYDAVIFQPVNAEGSFNNLKILLDAKLYVAIPDRIFVDSKINSLTAEQKKYLVLQVTSDNEQIAKDATETLVDYILRKDSNAFKVSGKKLLLMQGETSSSSNLERKKGFEDYFGAPTVETQGWLKTIASQAGFSGSRKPTLDLNTSGEWNVAKAQTKFDALANAGINNVGLGAFAANDQMASGIIKATRNTLAKLPDYPIVTVDANSKYKEQIAYDASLDKNKRVIANYAQRTATTMKAIVYCLYSAVIYKTAQENSFYEHAYEAIVKQGVPYVEDDETTNADDNAIVPLPDLSKPFVTNQRTIKLSGIRVERNQAGELQNENWMVD